MKQPFLKIYLAYSRSTSNPRCIAFCASVVNPLSPRDLWHQLRDLYLRPPCHWNKAHGQNSLLLYLRTVLLQKVKLLVFQSTDGNDHPAAIPQLFDKRLGDVIWGAGHDNGIEWGMFRPTLVAIPGVDFYVIVSKPFQVRLGSSSQRFNNLDGVDLRHQPR